jgi:hypothetical protein
MTTLTGQAVCLEYTLHFDTPYEADSGVRSGLLTIEKHEGFPVKSTSKEEDQNPTVSLDRDAICSVI